MATTNDRLDALEAAIREIRASIAYLDGKADQTANAHCDLVDELSGTSSAAPEPEPADVDQPIEWGPADSIDLRRAG